MKTEPAHRLLVDGHVHIYGCFDLPVLLDAACRHFATLGGAPDSNARLGVLMLSETARDDRYSELCELAAGGQAAGSWHFEHNSADPLAVRAQSPGNAELLLIAGRQVISREGLEILTLATAERIPDGRAAVEVIETAQAADALIVLPWAVGKWLGRRGQVMDELLDAHFVDEIMLGDNSGRPAFWPNPMHFRQARQRGMRILPGSDPLPLPREARRVGSFGCMLDAKLSSERPTGDLKRVLRDRGIPWRPFGRLETPARFVRNQLGLRLAKLPGFS